MHDEVELDALTQKIDAATAAGLSDSYELVKKGKVVWGWKPFGEGNNNDDTVITYI